MCGRMTQTTDPAEVARIFDAESTIDEDEDSGKPRYNVAPTQPLTVVTQRAEEGRLVEQRRWGLGMYPISTRVNINNVSNQGPELLEPVPEAPRSCWSLPRRSRSTPSASMRSSTSREGILETCPTTEAGA